MGQIETVSPRTFPEILDVDEAYRDFAAALALVCRAEGMMER